MIALFLVCTTVTTVAAQAPMDQVIQKWELVSKAFFFLLITAALATSRERIHALIWVMVLSLAYFGIKGGAFTLITGGTNRVMGPPNSIIGDNNHLATGLLVTLPLMNYLRMQSEHRLIRIGLTVTMALTLFSVVGSYSRGALLGLTAVTLYFWWKSKRKIVSGAVLGVMVASAIAFMPPQWMARMNTIESYQSDGSAENRLDLWRTSWLIATTRPLTGSGYLGPYTREVVDRYDLNAPARAVHSIWFETLGEHGFPTFFVWVGISVAGVVMARRVIKLTRDVPDLLWCTDLAKMAQVSMIAYLVGGTFLSLEYWDYYFTILVAVSACWEYARQTLGQTGRVAWRGAIKPLAAPSGPLPARREIA
jgi:putative inorganic carbon (hco3(-)) transporter